MSDQEFTQFPQMLTVKTRGPGAVIKVVPVIKDGRPVIFNDAHELKKYDGKGVAHDGKPEQHSHPNYSYTYDPFHTA